MIAFLNDICFRELRSNCKQFKFKNLNQLHPFLKGGTKSNVAYTEKSYLVKILRRINITLGSLQHYKDSNISFLLRLKFMFGYLPNLNRPNLT